jgi:hypothetical protein
MHLDVVKSFSAELNIKSHLQNKRGSNDAAKCECVSSLPLLLSLFKQKGTTRDGSAFLIAA